MTKKIVIIISIVILILLVIVFCIYHLPIYREIKYEVVFEKDAKTDLSDAYLKWFTVRDGKYNGFFDLEMLESYIGEEHEKLDVVDYTYIVTVGRQLKSISYSYSQMKNRNSIGLPKQFIGKVVLSEEQTNKIYVYKVKKIDIDCDYHNPNINIIYK